MIRRFGASPDPVDPAAEAATRLSLFEGPLDLGWHHCGSTSEFLGEFFAALGQRRGLDYNEARHGIGYLVNELLENAVKFRSPGPVLIEARLDGAIFAVAVRNRIAAGTAERFQSLLEELTTRDASELLIERIEANAADPSSSGSGLGLLTLMNDYGAQLGWEFGAAGEDRTVPLETRASLQLS